MKEEHIGRRFGKLTVKSIREIKLHWGRRWRALCACDCGAEKEIRLDHLTSGATKSCGCVHRGVTVINNSTHGLTRKGKVPLEFNSWSGMIDRCHRPGNEAYDQYGGRGISVCDRWRFGENGEPGFKCFMDDLGSRPDPKMSIERIDNAGNYEPQNCRWASKRDQANNRRSTRTVLAWGQSMTLAEALRRSSISEHCFYRRLRLGMTEAQALETLSRNRGGGFKTLRAAMLSNEHPSLHQQTLEPDRPGSLRRGQK